MKKIVMTILFISLFLISGCDGIQNNSISAKLKKDSVGITTPTSNESNSLEVQESDPPKKDEIKW